MTKGLGINNNDEELTQTIYKPNDIQKDEMNKIFVIPSPEEIKKELDKYIIGQEETKKTIQVQVNLHYKKIIHLYKDTDIDVEMCQSITCMAEDTKNVKFKKINPLHAKLQIYTKLAIKFSAFFHFYKLNATFL